MNGTREQAKTAISNLEKAKIHYLLEERMDEIEAKLEKNTAEIKTDLDSVKNQVKTDVQNAVMEYLKALQIFYTDVQNAVAESAFKS